MQRNLTFLAANPIRQMPVIQYGRFPTNTPSLPSTPDSDLGSLVSVTTVNTYNLSKIFTNR